jgi:hypothetical protein
MEEPTITTKKKRKRPVSTTVMALAHLRKLGWVADKVEQRIRSFITRDLYGVIDILAMDPVRNRLVGIQVTSGSNHAKRRDKILAEPRMQQWLRCGADLELWSYSKTGARGTRKLWTLRVETYAEMLANAEPLT